MEYEKIHGHDYDGINVKRRKHDGMFLEGNEEQGFDYIYRN